MRRVVVTGLGIISPLGNSTAEVTTALKSGTSGVEASPEMAEHGFRSQIAGTLKINPAEHIDKRRMRFMGPGAAYAYLSMEQAIADAGLSEDQVVNPMTGLIAGSGGPSTSAMLAAHQTVLKIGCDQTDRPVRGAKNDVLDCFCEPRNRVPDQRHELFDHLCLLDLAALYRHGRAAGGAGRPRHHVRRWRRRARLDTLVPL